MAISIRGLTKRYGRLVAVNNLSFEVRPGEVFGFLGLNGAGKTTTIRILLDLLRADAGSAAVFGCDCRREGLKVRAQVGYLPGEINIYGDLTGLELLDLMGRLQASPVSPRRRRELQERLELRDHDLRRKLRGYSTGMKRKLCLIQAFQGDAPLLILDEPTEGLDPLMQEALYELLSEARRDGRTVFFSSHVLPEVERVCDRIALIRRGELALLAGVEELHRMAERDVRIRFDTDVPPPAGGLPETFRILEAGERRWHLKARGALGPLLALISQLPVHDLEVGEARLEEVLLRYFREDQE